MGLLSFWMLQFGSYSYTSSTQVPALHVIIVFLVCDCICKQVVNRLKIPQGLSTLLFHRWNEVPSRGGVRGDSPLPYEKLPALQRCHLSQSLAMWFHWCYCFLFSVLFSIALLLLSLDIFSFHGFYFGFLIFTNFFFSWLFFFGGTFPPWVLLFLALPLAFSAQFFLVVGF